MKFGTLYILTAGSDDLEMYLEDNAPGVHIGDIIVVLGVSPVREWRDENGVKISCPSEYSRFRCIGPSGIVDLELHAGELVEVEL